MKDRFEFLGVTTPERKRAAKPFVAGRGASTDELLDAADASWAEPDREFQYVAADLLGRWKLRLDPESLPRVELLIRTKSWWDTVDVLAAHVVGALVARDPTLTAKMDDWIDDSDIWIARTAILHQLGYGPDTDVERLFDYVDRKRGDTEFFIRKACGWGAAPVRTHRPRGGADIRARPW